MSLDLPVNLRVLGYDIDTKAARDRMQSACGTVTVRHTRKDGFGCEMWRVWVRVNEHFTVDAYRTTLREAESECAGIIRETQQDCIVVMREVDDE